jgi:hypothetical protein
MVGLYLEDSIPENILNNMSEWENKYSTEESDKILTEVYKGIFDRRIVELQHTYDQIEQKELAVDNNIKK